MGDGVMRRSFKPMPADHIDDEDEQCRVRHDAFVASRRPRRRPSGFSFIACIAVFALVVGGAFYLAFTHH
jgi:hypothetical protein